MHSPLSERELRLASSAPDVILEGTLEAPAEGPCGLVLLLSGSGPQDRDETVAGQRPFARLRTGLASRGWAVFSWDDRGVGGSGGDYLAADQAALVADVRAVREGVLAETGALPTVYLGHSQGTFIASMAAVEVPGPDALILLAGSGRPGLDTLIEQHHRICRAEGLPDDWSEAALEMKRRVFDRLAQTPPEAAEEGIARGLRADIEAIVGEWVNDPGEVREIAEDFMEWEWRFIVRHDPESWLRRVACPTLVLAGEADTQVHAAVDVEATRAALAAGRCPRVDAEVLPGINHLFQRSASGALADYETAGEPFPDPVLAQLDAWLRSRLAG